MLTLYSERKKQCVSEREIGYAFDLNRKVKTIS